MRPTRRSSSDADSPEASSAAISVDSLTQIYESRSGGLVEALSDVTFTVESGEFISLLGPSGCGKTTVLKILAGLLKQTSGSVAISGQEVTGPQQNVGMVFQRPTLLPWRSVMQNVMLPVEIQGLDHEEYSKRAETLLEMVGLDSFRDSSPGELSGGMQQRAGICRALIHDPDVLLMDEPFGALDALTRERLNLELLQIWRQSGKTVVFVTHSISEAVFLSDRVFLLSARPGRIQEETHIDLPRPRELAMISSDRAGKHTNQIRQRLDAHGGIE